MESLILTIAARVLLPVLTVFGIFLLLTGHALPGGGFAAGLVFAVAVALHAFGNPNRGERELQRLYPRVIGASGLALMIVSGLVPLVQGKPFLTSQELPWKLPLFHELHLGTMLLFDVGVGLVAVGAVLTLLLTLEEHSPWRR